MNNKVDIYEEERPWGKFRRFTENVTSTVKIITINPEGELSLQSHTKRAEFWRVLSGSGIWQINDTKSHFMEGEEILIPVGAKHRIIAGDEKVEILEIATGIFDEGDIVRYEDKYGRV